MNQAGSSGVGGADGLPQHQQMQDVVGLAGLDPQFVILRKNMREKIFKYIGRRPASAAWRRRLPELSRRLEDILFRKFSNKNDYYNMMNGPVEPQLEFAIKTLQQNQQMSRQIASSSGYGTMIPTPGITQGTSGNSRMPYVTDNTGLSSSGAGMVPQNASMGTSLPAVHDKVKVMEQIKDVDSLKPREIGVYWVGMAENVQIMGSFDGWSQGEGMSMEYSGDYARFSATLKLRPGRYEIKFLVDGDWRLSPEYPIAGEGLTHNNILIVE